MKAKILLTALSAFLLVNGNAFTKSSSLNIDIVEHPLKTYVIEMRNGAIYETASDIRINNLRVGINGLKIYKRIYKGNQRGRQKFNERLIYSGTVNIPSNSVVFSQLRNRELFVNNIIPKNRLNHTIGIRPRVFQDLVFTIQNESFDKDRLQIMNLAVRNSALNTRQIVDLMSLLSFDSYKLRLAKNAYANTIDKQNYFVVRNGLTFISNKRELTNFVSNSSYKNQPSRDNRRDRNCRRR